MVTGRPDPDDLAVTIARALRTAANMIEDATRAAVTDAGPTRPNGHPLRTRQPTKRGTTIITLCMRPEGATQRELMDATGSPPSTPWKLDVERLRKYGYIVRLSKRNGMSCYHLDPAPEI